MRKNFDIVKLSPESPIHEALDTGAAYKEFTDHLKLFFKKNPALIATTLSNIFTMRLIGNKTHGDLAEIAIAEFINQYLYTFKSIHVGKDLYRAKSREEDITVINELTRAAFPVSLKAYGDGPLQLSTDKTSAMFKRLEQTGKGITNRKEVSALLKERSFDSFKHINVLPLIYDEHRKRCNIMVFDYQAARNSATKVIRGNPGIRGRKHPVYTFLDRDDEYICEVRYGDVAANALQRGLWTHTRNGMKYFDSLTGWIDYSHNTVLVKLFSHALVSSATGHSEALETIKADILRLKKMENL
jgi:hypothetical protein